VQIDELAVFVKKADSYLSDIYHLHMEFLPPDAIQIVENKEVLPLPGSASFPSSWSLPVLHQGSG